MARGLESSGANERDSQQMGTAMNILTATKDFEDWVSRHTHVVKSQLSDKHKQMAESPVQFLRGTFIGGRSYSPKFAGSCAKRLQ